MRRVLLSTLAGLAFAGCGQFLTPQDYQLHPYRGLDQSQPDSARVVVLWTDRRAGSATLAVMQNGAIVGGVQGGSYFSTVVAPGRHTFAVDSGLIEKTREQVSFEAQPGKTYFLHYTPGGFYVVAKLELIAEDVAMAQLPALNSITLAATAR